MGEAFYKFSNDDDIIYLISKKLPDQGKSITSLSLHSLRKRINPPFLTSDLQLFFKAKHFEKLT